MRNAFAAIVLLSSSLLAAPASEGVSSVGQGIASSLVPAFIAAFKPLFPLFIGFAFFYWMIHAVKGFIRACVEGARDRRYLERWRGRQEFNRRRARLDRQSRRLRRNDETFRNWRGM